MFADDSFLGFFLNHPHFCQIWGGLFLSVYSACCQTAYLRLQQKIKVRVVSGSGGDGAALTRPQVAGAKLCLPGPGPLLLMAQRPKKIFQDKTSFLSKPSCCHGRQEDRLGAQQNHEAGEGPSDALSPSLHNDHWALRPF